MTNSTEQSIEEVLDYPTLKPHILDKLVMLIEAEKLKARLDERNQIALDNYYGKTISNETDWRAKFDYFIKGNDRRIWSLTRAICGLESQMKDKDE